MHNSGILKRYNCNVDFASACVHAILAWMNGAASQSNRTWVAYGSCGVDGGSGVFVGLVVETIGAAGGC